MVDILGFLVLLGLCILLLGYVNASRLQWAGGLIAGLVLATVLTGPAWLFLALIWFFVLSAVFVLLSERWRLARFSRPLLALFKAKMPAMSATEQEALEVGEVGWEGELFGGRPDWRKLAAIEPGLSDEEQAFLDGPVETLCAMVDDWEVTHALHDLPPEAWRYIKEQKFFGMIIPKEYGGLGFSAQGHAAVIVKLASRSITAAVTVMVPNSLGPGQLLLNYGTDEQKRRYLPGLVTGAELPCFALTAREAGSDAAAMTDRGVVCRAEFEGRPDVLGVRLNWSKRYITLSPVATLLGLAFKLYDPEHLLGEREELGITLALIPTDTQGVIIGRRHMPGANPFQNGPTQGRDVFIPLDWIIGGVDYAGKGWRMLMECLSEGRGVSLPSLSVASVKLCCHTTSAYATVRRQFNNPIARFEGVEEVLARITGFTYLVQGASRLTLAVLDSGIRPAVATAIVKYHLTEMMRVAINDAMDVHGGKGIMLGPSNYLMRCYQAIPISITVEGANILTRNLIIFGQGAMRCHPCLLDEIKAASAGEAGLQAFDRALGRHIGHIIGSLSRAFLLGLSFGYLSDREKGRRTVTRLSAALAFSVEMALLLVGGQLKRRERLSARLGDALSYLYLASGAMLQFDRHDCPREEKPLYEWSIDYCAWQVQQALWALSQNLPWAPRWVLRFICFPFGRRYAPPGDRLDHRVAALTLTPGPVRERLVNGIFVPKQEDQALRILGAAFERSIACEAAEAKIRQALRDKRLSSDDTVRAVEAGVITQEEAAAIEAARELSRKAIQVDDFSLEEYVGRT